jgi:hypothetical protein
VAAGQQLGLSLGGHPGAVSSTAFSPNGTEEDLVATGSLTAGDLRVRLAVYHYMLEHTQAPSCDELAVLEAMPVAEVRQALHRLHQHHLLVMNPDADTIRMAHPLSAVATAYPVQVGGKRLWANCAWDSLGIPAMLGSDASIATAFTFSGEPTHYTVEAGTLRAPDGGLVHFPLPFRRWYDDLIHTCATMLLFRSDEVVDAWCAATGEPRGETVPLPQVWTLSREWYAPRLDPAYRGRSAAQAVAVFEHVGLRSEFWRA